MTEILKALDDFLGTHFIYTYDNGWEYEWYARNDHAVDYRVHDGMVARHWVKDQEANVVMFIEGVYKVVRAEPTGTSVAPDSAPNERKLNGVIFLPAWVHEHPEITVCLQSGCADLMEESHEKHATYPKLVVPGFAYITYMGDAGQNNEDVISEAPYEGLSDNIRNGKYFDDNYKRLKK